jgi:enoyl-CoA hydratase/carnithine racemase
MSDYELIRYEPVKDSDVVVITLNRPEKLNAISSPLAVELADAFQRFDKSDAFVAILTGAGRAFTGGMDVLENMAAGRTTMASPDLGDSYNPFHPGQPVDDGTPTPRHARTLKKLVIAAVHGYVFGGGFIMAMAADLCVAAESAVFEFSEVYRGMAVGWDMGYLYRFPRNVSMELALGLRMGARRAYELGLVNRLVPDDELVPSAIDLAKQLCRLPRSVLTANRDLVDELIPTIPEQVAAHAEEVRRRLAGSPESVAAFREFAEAHGYGTR